jgi:hypothetical protein
VHHRSGPGNVQVSMAVSIRGTGRQWRRWWWRSWSRGVGDTKGPVRKVQGCHHKESSDPPPVPTKPVVCQWGNAIS